MKKQSLVFLFLAIIAGVVTLFAFRVFQSDSNTPALLSEGESKAAEALEGEKPVAETTPVPISSPTPIPTPIPTPTPVPASAQGSTAQPQWGG